MNNTFVQEYNYDLLAEWRGKLLDAIYNNHCLIDCCLNAIDSLFPDIMHQVNKIMCESLCPVTVFKETRIQLYLSISEAKLRERYSHTFSYNTINTLFYSPNRCQVGTIMYCQNNQQLTREDLLKVTGYAIKVAQIKDSNNPYYDKAVDALTVCRAINDSLNGQMYNMPTAKMMHYANDFMTKVVLSRARTEDEKRVTYGMSLLVDLVIDMLGR